MRDTDKLNLKKRQYIWQGGTYPRSNPDGTAHPKAGQAWCFVYGEQEWLKPEFNVPNPEKPNERIDARYQDYFDRADNNDEHKISCE